MSRRGFFSRVFRRKQGADDVRVPKRGRKGRRKALGAPPPCADMAAGLPASDGDAAADEPWYRQSGPIFSESFTDRPAPPVLPVDDTAASDADDPSPELFAAPDPRGSVPTSVPIIQRAEPDPVPSEASGWEEEPSSWGEEASEPPAEAASAAVATEPDWPQAPVSADADAEEAVTAEDQHETLTEPDDDDLAAESADADAEEAVTAEHQHETLTEPDDDNLAPESDFGAAAIDTDTDERAADPDTGDSPADASDFGAAAIDTDTDERAADPDADYSPADADGDELASQAGPSEADGPAIIPIRGYYVARTEDTLRSVAAQFLNAPERWSELQSLNAAYPGVADAGPDTLLPEGTALALPGDPLPWGRPDPVYLWTLAETFLFTAWGREPTPEEVVPFWRGLSTGALTEGQQAAALGTELPGIESVTPPSAPGDAPPTSPPPAFAMPPAAPDTARDNAPPPPEESEESTASLEPDLDVAELDTDSEPHEPDTTDADELHTETEPHEPDAADADTDPHEPETADADTEPHEPETADADELDQFEAALDTDTDEPDELEQLEADADVESTTEWDPAPADTSEPTDEAWTELAAPAHLDDADLDHEPEPADEFDGLDDADAASVDEFDGLDDAVAEDNVAAEAEIVAADLAEEFYAEADLVDEPIAPPHGIEPPLLPEEPAAPPMPPSAPTEGVAPPTAPAERIAPPPSFDEWSAPGVTSVDDSAPYAGLTELDPFDAPERPAESEAPRAPQFMPSITGASSAALSSARPVKPVGRSMAGTAIGDAMMLWQLARRRRSGRTAGAAASAVELSLQQTASSEALVLIEAAMRHLWAVTVGQGQPSPAVLAVRVGTYGFEVLLERATHAPPGWRSASEGYVLELPQGVTAHDLGAVGPGPSLCPALVPVGNTFEGPLLLNLQQIGTLAVSGPSEPVTRLIAAIVATLASSPMASDIDITAVGLDAAASGVGWERVRLAQFDSAELNQLLEPKHDGDGVAEDRHSMVFFGPGHDLLIQRAHLAATAPFSRLSVVGATSAVGTRWPWSVHVDGTGTAVVQPVAITMTAAQAPPPETFALA